MPHGKPAGVRCVQLGADNRCLIFGQPERPAVCSGLAASLEMCGSDEDAAHGNTQGNTHGNHHAMLYLARLESLTTPQ